MHATTTVPILPNLLHTQDGARPHLRSCIPLLSQIKAAGAAVLEGGSWREVA
jgi:hypothetical protein